MNVMLEMNLHTRDAISDSLYKYDHLAKKDSFIEVTEWTNGEGWDITIDDKTISLTMGELSAINFLTNALMYKK